MIREYRLIFGSTADIKIKPEREDMNAIKQLDTGTSLFFDHRDPAMVKLLSEAKRNT